MSQLLKQWGKILLIGVVLMQLIACEKAELNYLDEISAGQTAGIGIKYSGILSDTLFFDYPSSSASRLIDLNDDGIDDFELKFSGSASPGHGNSKNFIIPFGSNALAIPNLENDIVDTLSLNDKIDSSINWINDSCTIYNYYWDASGSTSRTGLWNNVKNKYIGLKILVDNKVLYGWIRIEVTFGWNLTLIDYASTVGYEN